MSEIRENLITGNWTIFAPKRGSRPNDHKNKKKDIIRNKKQKKMKMPIYEKSCPFCPGNEEMLPSVIYEEGLQIKSHKAAPARGISPSAEKKWQVRVVPNKYPALAPENRNQVFEDGLFSYMKCAGYQEVIVETPIHNKNIAQFKESEIEILIDSYIKRYKSNIQDRRIKTILIFRNQGEKAGASRIHGHSQLIAMGFVPSFIEQVETRAKKHFMITKKNLFLETLRYELRKKERIIFENELFAAFIPYAAQVPYEIWIMPKRQKADFGKITPLEKKMFIKILLVVLGKLYKKLDNPDYNMVIHTASKDHANTKYMQWYVQIRPVFSISAGFEIATQMFINSLFPEDCAKTLS